MKTILILALATLSLIEVPAVRACDSAVTASYCAPTLLCTKELCRSTECRWSVNSCGHRYSYEVTVVTFGRYFSDGSVERFTRSFRS